MLKIRQILITGMPGSGKTSLIKKLANNISEPYSGFFTGEIREKGIRTGFEVETFSGKKEMLAHININSKLKLSKYGVDIEGLEKLAIPEIEKALEDKSLLIIDEIGKMELFSERFKNFLNEVYKSKIRLIATMMYKPNPICDHLKKAPGTKLFVLQKGRSSKLYEQITALISSDFCES